MANLGKSPLQSPPLKVDSGINCHRLKATNVRKSANYKVEHCFREAGVGGSNPLAPTIYKMPHLPTLNGPLSREGRSGFCALWRGDSQ